MTSNEIRRMTTKTDTDFFLQEIAAQLSDMNDILSVRLQPTEVETDMEPVKQAIMEVVYAIAEISGVPPPPAG